jgi:hypothetical protein
VQKKLSGHSSASNDFQHKYLLPGCAKLELGNHNNFLSYTQVQLFKTDVACKMCGHAGRVLSFARVFKGKTSQHPLTSTSKL